MNRFFTALFTLLIAASVTFAGGNTIKYTFQVDVPLLGTISTGENTVSEGSTFTLPAHTFTDYPFIQEAYDAVVGSTFSIPNEFVNENVELAITLCNFLGNASGYHPLQNGASSVNVFMYFQIAVVGEQSGLHTVTEHYPGGWPTAADTFFINPAVLKIPITAKLLAFASKFGITGSDLAMAYDEGGTLSTSGIQSTIQDDTLKVSILHFSRFGGTGKTQLTDVTDKNNTLVKEFRLEQNYPNPFNPTTNIKYSVPEDGYVTLKVYNALGAEVMTLFSGNQKAGTHQSVFNAGSLSSGVYFYTLKFENTTQTKRMILIK